MTWVSVETTGVLYLKTCMPSFCCSWILDVRYPFFFWESQTNVITHHDSWEKNMFVFFLGGRGAIVLCLFFGGTESQLQKYKLVQLMKSRQTSNPTQHSKMGFIHLEFPTSNPPKHSGYGGNPLDPIYGGNPQPHPARELNNRSGRRLIQPQHPPLGPRATAAPTPKSGDLKLSKQKKTASRRISGRDVGHSWNAGWWLKPVVGVYLYLLKVGLFL